MKQIRVHFDTDTPESYKQKTMKKVEKLGWIQNDKKVQLIPASNDPNQNARYITVFFDWPHESDPVYPIEVEFAILP